MEGRVSALAPFLSSQQALLPRRRMCPPLLHLLVLCIPPDIAAVAVQHL